jgi:hypothetical protein
MWYTTRQEGANIQIWAYLDELSEEDLLNQKKTLWKWVRFCYVIEIGNLSFAITWYLTSAHDILLKKYPLKPLGKFQPTLPSSSAK